MSTQVCSPLAVTFFTGLLYLAIKVSADIVITTDPAYYVPGSDVSIRCHLGNNTGNVIEDVYAISIGWVEGGSDKVVAGISVTELPQVAFMLRSRAAAMGQINHTALTESYLTLILQGTSCADVREYFCRMNIKNGVIIHATTKRFNYTVEGGVVCVDPTTTPINTTVTQDTVSCGTTPSQHILTMALCVMAISVLRMRH